MVTLEREKERLVETFTPTAKLSLVLTFERQPTAVNVGLNAFSSTL